jgi:hypothetical protein
VTRFLRTDQSDGASEVLAMVAVERDSDGAQLGRYVQVMSGPEVGDDFVGLFDLDGDRVELWNVSWEIVEPTDFERAEILEGWCHGNTTVEVLS